MHGMMCFKHEQSGQEGGVMEEEQREKEVEHERW